MKRLFQIIKNRFLLLIILMFALNSTFLDVQAGACSPSVIDEKMKGSVTIERYVQDGEKENSHIPLAGIEYRITYQYRLDGTKVKESDSDYYQSVKATDKDGKVSFTKLALGTYQVDETGGIPAGYEKSDSFQVNVPTTNLTEVNCGGVAYEPGTVWEYDITACLKNQFIYGAVQLTKYDTQSGAKLKGAVFQLYNENGEAYCTKSGKEVKLTTDQNGVIEILHLPYGTYYFQEVKAPEGYKLSDEKKYFSITESYVEDKESTMVKVAMGNTPITPPRIPPVKTGDTSNVSLWFSILLAAVFMLAAVRKKRHKSKEE